MRRFERFLSSLLAAWVLLGLAGCETVRRVVVQAPPPPQNYFSPATQGAPMRRVALLPLYNEKYPGEYLRNVDSAFNGELVKKSLFEVVAVSRSQMEALFGQRQLSSVESLPAGLLEKLRDQYGVDGVLFMDLTQFSPYSPLSIGVRMKLVDVSTSQIRWAFDYIYDAGHPAVAESAKRYQLQYSNQQLPIVSDGGSVLLSPTQFSKYVANQTFQSLKAQ